jgi:hypothetical protein
MNRVALVISGIVIGVAGTSFLFAPSVMSASADNYTMARAAAFVWEDGSSPPEGASEFCLQVYEGTRAEVTIVMTLLDGAEVIGAPIEDFYTMADSGELVAVRTCFDEDVANDPQGSVAPIEEAPVALFETPATTNGCGENWNGRTVEEMRPGWWKTEQDKFQANLEAAIANNEPGLSLEEASLKSWAGRVEVGPDVTTMDLPTWMRNLIIPYCDLGPDELAAVRDPGSMPPPAELSPEESEGPRPEEFYSWLSGLNNEELEAWAMSQVAHDRAWFDANPELAMDAHPCWPPEAMPWYPSDFPSPATWIGAPADGSDGPYCN